MGLLKVEFLSCALEMAEMAACKARVEGPSESYRKLVLGVQQGIQQRVGFAKQLRIRELLFIHYCYLNTLFLTTNDKDNNSG